MADLVTVGVSASSSLSPSSVLSLLDRARGAVSARELRVVVSMGVAAPSALSSQRPPPPRPPGMNLRRLLGGSVASSGRELTRDLAGVRVGRRGDISVEAMVVAEVVLIACAEVVLRDVVVERGEASLWWWCVLRRRCCACGRAWLCADAAVSR